VGASSREVTEADAITLPALVRVAELVKGVRAIAG
jgi:hypothetical protein